MDVALGGEVEPGSDVPPGRADPGAVTRVEPVHGAVVLVGFGLDVPLEVGSDLAQERRADALRNRQLLRPGHAVFLR